jgi:hypothetical protein
VAEIKKYAPQIYLDKNGYEGCRARIYLYGDPTARRADGFIGTISLYDTGKEPPPTGVGANGELFASAEFTLFDGILDLLRHEGPTFYEHVNGSYRISCGQEPAGEDET